MDTIYLSEPLTGEHDLTKFDSGQPVLDTWLRNSAMRGSVQNTGRTWVWHADDNQVVAYFTLSAFVIVRDDLGLSNTQARKLPQKIPAILLAKLALDQSLHGGGFGGALLADALGRCVRVSEMIGARYVAVDAIDDNAANFYLHYGFDATPNAGYRLVRPMTAIAADLEEDAPIV